MQNKINHEIAVLDDAYFINAKLERTPLSAPISNLSELARQALDADMRYIWVLPGSQLSKCVDRSFITSVGEEWDVFASYSQQDKTRPMFACIWHKEAEGRAGRTIYAGFPEYGTWPWKISDTISLLATVSYIEQALGLPVIWSPGRMALDLLKALNAKGRAGWLHPLSIDLRTLPTNDGKTLPIMKVARDLTWKRALTTKEKRMKYIHKFDKNSMYLAACTGIFVGEDNPDHVEGAAFDDRLPGFWRIKADCGESLYNGRDLPTPARAEWLTTPMVSCCQKLGYQVEVIEGYQWHEQGKYHRTLESWANTLWEVRQSLKVASTTYKHERGRQNAYATISAIAHVGVGKLADEDTSGGLYRPDIWALIVGRACANIFYNIDTIRKNTGMTPVLVYTDALWFVSNEPNPEIAVPGILDREDKLGGYKKVYEEPLPMSKAVIDAFATIESPTKLVRTLNGLAGEEEL